MVAGQLSGWTVIGAEQTANGYDVALKLAGTNEFTVWLTNSSGTYQSNLTVGAMLGTDPALESIETLFQQDLNGDGIIGPPAAGGSVAANLRSKAASSADNFRFSSNDFHFSNSDSGAAGQAPASAGNHSSVAAVAGHDSFAFAPVHGPASTASSLSWADVAPSSNSAVTNIHAALTAAHEDTFGTSAVPNVSHVAHLWAHHDGFHIV